VIAFSPGLLATTSVETMDLSVSKVSYSIAEVSNEDLALIQVRSLLTVFLGVLKE